MTHHIITIIKKSLSKVIIDNIDCSISSQSELQYKIEYDSSYKLKVHNFLQLDAYFLSTSAGC